MLGLAGGRGTILLGMCEVHRVLSLKFETLKVRPQDCN